MSRRTAAVLTTLLVAPAAGIILGHRRAALGSFLADLVVMALFVAGALLILPSLIIMALVVALVVRVNQIVQAVRLPLTPNPPTAGRVVLLILTLIVADDLIAHGAKTWLVEAFKIPAGSMIPTLQVGDHIFVDKRATKPARGEVIVFKYPREPDKDFVKRVIAVGGDTLEMVDGAPVVNGHPVERHHLSEDCRYQDYDAMQNAWSERHCQAWQETLDGRSYRVVEEGGMGYPPAQSRWTVPPGQYFVMGDNRNNSHDSRYWGFVPPENIKGTARFIWWSSGPEGIRTDRLGQPIN